MTISSEITQGLELKSLRAGTVIDVETRSREYHIEYLGGNAIRISGHPDYCPKPELAEFYGAMGEEGEVEFGVIEPGMRLTFFLNHRPVTTSKVLNVSIH